jgi:biotin transport system substrate-specific component
MFKSALLATAFAALIAICAQVSVPMVPVPMTLQTWAVLLAGLVLGVRWGAASVALYLLAAAVGLPVLSDGRSGIDALTGPTAGYLAAFPIVAGLAGAMSHSERFRHPWVMIAGLTGLHAIVLALGAAWLARSTGVEAAISGGLLPFLPGAVVKSGAAWLAWRGLVRLHRP